MTDLYINLIAPLLVTVGTGLILSECVVLVLEWCWRRRQ